MSNLVSGSFASRARVVDSIWIAHTPVAFRDLCERAIPPETRLIVLDLDRTLHLGRNMGELLGWEISAYRGYGAAYLEELEPRRSRRRMYIELRRPLLAVRYLWRAARVWGPPGLFYVLWCKLAARIPLVRRRSYARFGPEPVHAVQRIPQDALFAQMASLSPAIVRDLAARVWARYGSDQTVERDDLAWLRRRCPGVRVVLSSASPREVAEIAGRELGFDDVIGSSPGRINGGRAKLAELCARYQELRTPGAVTVGISDTGYGEDHCWTEAFTHVVDVNSTSPFPPIVSGGSPLRSIFSAPILTRAEKEARVRGDAWLDPRRGRAAGDTREFQRQELEALLAPLRAAIERFSDAKDGPVAELAFALACARERARRVLEEAPPRQLAAR
jgi:haloacid dehalogenase-like hydrolase